MNVDNKILVTGSGGFLGKDIVKHLLIRGWRVKAMVRSAVNFSFLHNKNLEVIYGEMRDAESIKAAMNNVDVVVHLAASKADEKNSHDVNVEGAKRLVRACREEGCKRIINISTQSVKIKHKGVYANTKKEAEKVFHSSGLQVTSLRPSIVYGEEKLGVFGTVLNFIQKLPFVPILGDGKWISAPIYIGDISKSVISCIEKDCTIGRVYDLGGNDQISFDSFIDKICIEMGIRRFKIHVPLMLSMVAARFLSKIMSRPPITVSNVLGSNQDTGIDISTAQRDFGFNPLSIDKGFKLVLGKMSETDDVDIKDNISYDDESFEENELIKEAVLITRYMLGCSPDRDLCYLYADANKVHFTEKVARQFYPELDFIHRHPSTLPFIDAGSGVMYPDTIVRKKILLMTAILETTPAYASFFLKRSSPFFVLFKDVIWNGLKSIIKICIGVPLIMIVRRAYNG